MFTFLPLIWSSFFQALELKGTYKMVYNKKYGDTSRSILPLSIINFKDSTYSIKVKNEIVENGKITILDSENRAYLVSNKKTILLPP